MATPEPADVAAVAAGRAGSGDTVGGAERGSATNGLHAGPAAVGLPSRTGQTAPPSPPEAMAAAGAAGPRADAMGNSTAGQPGAHPHPAEVPLPPAAYQSPQRVQLQRNARQPGASAIVNPQAGPASTLRLTADDGQGQLRYLDAEGRAGSVQAHNAQVSEQDLGLQFMPGSTPVPEASSRATDPTSGTVLATTLNTTQPMARVATHYRNQLNRNGTVEETIPAPGELLLTTVDTQTGINRSVWIGQERGQVLVRLMQATPAAATVARRP